MIADIERDIADLMAVDPFFAPRDNLPPSMGWRKSDDLFAALIRIIIAQQLSTRAADALWQKTATYLGGDFSPRRLNALSDDEWRHCGLSRQKMACVRAVTAEVLAGELDLESFRSLPDDDVIRKMTSIKGLGPWSAQMFLIFTLHRRDVWPVNDLGIRRGVGRYKGLEALPSVAEVTEFGMKFGGRRTALSLLLWAVA